MNINDLFRGRRAPEQNEVTQRDVATISAELDAAKAAVDTLAEKIAIAQQELDDARAEYDANVSRYALSGGREPDHADVEKQISKLEALRRVLRDQQNTVARLQSELTQAQRAENIANDEANIEALIADAETNLQTFLQLAFAAKAAEVVLFDSLFRSALKDGRIGSRERSARLEIARKAIAATGEIGFRINPDFATDGNPNLGDPDRAWEAHVQEQHRQAVRISESLHSSKLARTIGELVMEEPTER